MNLALKDIRHGLFRFVLTCFGLGLLMTVVLSMIGIYNGLVADALAVVKAPAADVWVVESGSSRHGMRSTLFWKSSAANASATSCGARARRSENGCSAILRPCVPCRRRRLMPATRPALL